MIMTIRLVSSTIPFPRTVMKHIVLKYVHSKPTISMKKYQDFSFETPKLDYFSDFITQQR